MKDDVEGSHRCDAVMAAAFELPHGRGQYGRCRIGARQRGFSLIELVVVIIIVGVLAAIAVPRYIALGRDARVAAVNTMASTLNTAAINVHTLCMLANGCDYSVYSQTLTIAGRSTMLNYGWPEAGDDIGGNQIDVWVNYSGFTVSLPNSLLTLFTLDGSPTPANCSVLYQQAGGQAGPTITVTTTGC